MRGCSHVRRAHPILLPARRDLPYRHCGRLQVRRVVLPCPSKLAEVWLQLADISSLSKLYKTHIRRCRTVLSLSISSISSVPSRSLPSLVSFPETLPWSSPSELAMTDSFLFFLRLGFGFSSSSDSCSWRAISAVRFLTSYGSS